MTCNLYYTFCYTKCCAAIGTCASIGYSTSCCPPGGNCQASDGECHCDSNCHLYDDCCPDVHCTAGTINGLLNKHSSILVFSLSEPRTCADVGFTSCCNDRSNSVLCEVHFIDAHYHADYCACNVSCHLRNDCCNDAETIGCVGMFS